MGSRYLVTGSQLGMLIALCQTDSNKCNQELNKIIESQLVGESEYNINEDIIKVGDLFSQQTKESLNNNQK